LICELEYLKWTKHPWGKKGQIESLPEVLLDTKESNDVRVCVSNLIFPQNLERIWVWTISSIECINRAITVGVDKNRDYSQTYGNRVDGQLARLTLGESWVREIFLSFGVPLCKKII
jgi:hypothetical protein